MPVVLSDATWIGRAVLARVFQDGELVPVGKIPSSVFPPSLAAAWAATGDAIESGVQAAEEIIPRVLQSGVEPGFLGTLIDDQHRHLIPSAAAGLDRLVALCAHREALRLAERLPHAIASGDGTEQVEKIASILRSSVLTNSGGAPLSALDLPSELVRPAEPIPFILEPRIGRGDAAILAADAGAGKTIIATDTGLGLATGEPCALGSVPSVPTTVAYFDGEMSRQLALHRLRRQAAGRGIKPADFGDIPFHYFAQVSLDLTSDDALHSFRKTIDACRAEVVIIDSMIRFAGSLKLDKDNTDIATFFGRVVAPLCAEGRTVLLLHHLRKGNGQNGDENAQHRVRGGSDIAAAVSAVLLVEKGLNGSTRVVTQTKCRWQTEPPPVRIEFEGEAGDSFLRVTTTGGALDAEALVLNALGDAGRAGLLRQALIAVIEDAGSADPENTAKKALGRLKARSRILTRADGRAARYWARDFAPTDLLATVPGGAN